MAGFVPYAFTDAQLTDIRRYCGFPARADGNVLFAAPWVNVQYLALEYRLQHLSQTEGAVVVQYLTTLNTLEAAIPAAGANLDTDQAAVWYHNKNEVRDRSKLFDSWRRRLCGFLGIEQGPNFGGGGNSIQLVV